MNSPDYDIELRSVRIREHQVKVRNGLSVDSILPRSDYVPLTQGFHGDKDMTVSTYQNADGDNRWLYTFLVAVAIRLIEPVDLEDGRMEKDDYEGLLTINSAIEVIYESKQEITFIEGKAAELGLNPIQTAWPFWRDIVSSACQRVGFYPPIRIPEFPS